MAEKNQSLEYSCEICGASNLTDDEMREHVVLCHMQNTLTCPICNMTSNSTAEMLAHVNSDHLEYLTPDQDMIAFIDEEFELCNNVSKVNDQSRLSADMKNMKVKGYGETSTGNMNRTELANSCRIGGAGTNSPQRQNLDLNLSNTKTRPLLLTSPLNICPICNKYQSDSTKDMEHHLNREHFDLNSPSIKASCSGSSPPPPHLKCPLCNKNFDQTSDVELHVNIEHSDILSPGGQTQSPQCPVCCLTNFASTMDLTRHIENHFSNNSKGSTPMTPSTNKLLQSLEHERQERETRRLQEEQEFELLRAQYGMDNDGNFNQQSLANMEKAVYSGELSVADYYEKRIFLRNAESNGFDDCSSCTKDIVDVVRRTSMQCSNVNQTLTCTTVDHYAATYGDKGWGCGFRNIQMMLSALLRHTGYNNQLYRLWLTSGNRVEPSRSTMPSISRIQAHIEWAWRQGFDTQGADQLGLALVNTRKWIGATELVTFLSSLRIRCQLVDFHQPSSSDGCHPELFNWVLEYFSNEDDFKPPLYLQHQGHSRTIMGVEQLKDGSLHLLILDPSHSVKQMSQCRDERKTLSLLRLLRKSSNQMKAPQYQVVAVTGIMDTEAEYQQSKIIKSIRVPQDR
uniref:Zinc finger-containing ubiquitin peptidase 1 n=2 Tax=Cacopsylla melanoneura TaxID=428564 RepID=A0A8D8QUU4_9HEMI